MATFPKSRRGPKYLIVAAVGDITIALGSVARIMPDLFVPEASASLNLRKTFPLTGKFKFPFLSRTEGRETEGSLRAMIELMLQKSPDL